MSGEHGYEETCDVIERLTRERDEAKEWNAGQLERFARELRYKDTEIATLKAQVGRLTEWLHKDDPAMLATIAAAEAQRDEALALLRECEWEGAQAPGSDEEQVKWHTCPLCWKPAPHHAPDCALAKALRGGA